MIRVVSWATYLLPVLHSTHSSARALCSRPTPVFVHYTDSTSPPAERRSSRRSGSRRARVRLRTRSSTPRSSSRGSSTASATSRSASPSAHRCPFSSLMPSPSRSRMLSLAWHVAWGLGPRPEEKEEKAKGRRGLRRGGCGGSDTSGCSCGSRAPCGWLRG